MIPSSKDAAMQQYLLDCKANDLTQKAHCQQQQIPSHIFLLGKNIIPAGFIVGRTPVVFMM